MPAPPMVPERWGRGCPPGKPTPASPKGTNDVDREAKVKARLPGAAVTVGCASSPILPPPPISKDSGTIWMASTSTAGRAHRAVPLALDLDLLADEQVEG